ncbi:MAG TPA: STAS domain-containing protein [Actinomycetota bacterium]|nr:STAS domain-containing protein [Actinomycetota bacterium]
MTLTIKKGNGVVRLTGELDIAGEGDFTKALQPEIERGGDVTLDLGGLTFIDSSGVRAIIVAADRINGNGRIVLRSPGNAVQRVLDLMRLDTVPNVEVERQA